MSERVSFSLSLFFFLRTLIRIRNTPTKFHVDRERNVPHHSPICRRRRADRVMKHLRNSSFASPSGRYLWIAQIFFLYLVVMYLRL